LLIHKSDYIRNTKKNIKSSATASNLTFPSTLVLVSPNNFILQKSNDGCTSHDPPLWCGSIGAKDLFTGFAEVSSTPSFFQFEISILNDVLFFGLAMKFKLNFTAKTHCESFTLCMLHF